MTVSVVSGTNLTTPDTTRTYTVTIGGHDVSSDVQWDSLEFEDQGSSAQGTTSFRINGKLSDYPGIRDQQIVEIVDHIAGGLAFRGLVDSRHPVKAEQAWDAIEIICSSHDSILDNVIPLEIRPSGESDNARISYLWGKYATGFLSADLTYVQQVSASLPAQTFAGVSLRQALDMIAAQASSSAFFYLDAAGRIHYGTSETNNAPKNVTSDTPGAGEIAPMDLDIDFDSKGYIGAVYVRGKTDAGSGWVYSETSKANHNGLIRTTFLDAADCTTGAMRNALGNMYLGRVGTALARGSFTCTSQDADGWRAGQNVNVRSSHFNVDRSFRIARVRTRVLGPLGSRPSGLREYTVEFGSASGGRGGSQGPVVATGIVGDILDDQGNLLLGSGSSSTASGFGPAIRRYITSGVYNGDFALAPPYPDSTIVEAWNPLPFWTFTQASGVAITAQSVEDAGSGSGRVLEFDMAAGDAGDDSYIEQIIPINSSQNRAYGYAATVAVADADPANSARAYITIQYLTLAGTTTGSSATFENTLTNLIAGTLPSELPVGEALGAAPADAYFLRVRIGMRRDVAATTATGTVTFSETYLTVGQPAIEFADTGTPGNSLGVIFLTDNLLSVQAGLGVSIDAPTLFANTAAISGLLRHGDTVFPASPNTSDLYYRTDHAMWFRYDGTRWVCTCPHSVVLTNETGLPPIAATASNWQRAAFPNIYGLDMLVEGVDCLFVVSGGGTALGASHKWVGTVARRNTGTSIGTLNIDSGASGAFRNVQDTSDFVVVQSTDWGCTVTWTKTGTPGDLNATVTVNFRFIAT